MADKETDPAKIRDIHAALAKLYKQADAIRIALNAEGDADEQDQGKVNRYIDGLKKVTAEINILKARL
jgi:hypothetical protein